MTDGSIAPVAAGLGVGIAFVMIFAVATHNSIQPVQQSQVANELPQVKLVVLDTSHEQGLSYSGERGTYCWHNFGCADTGIMIPPNSISVDKGSIIKFDFLDSYHNDRAPDELAVVAFDPNRDLEVFSATKGRIGGDVEIATFDFGNKPIPYLPDIENRSYALDLTEREYIIWVHSAWYLNRENGEQVFGDGNVSYFYRISVS